MSSYQDSADQFEVDSPAPAPAEANSVNGSHHAQDSFSNFDDTEVDYPPPVYGSGGELPSDPDYFSSETNANGQILPPPSYMEQEESYALREWRRENTIRLEEKEKREKEILSQILIEAEQYKVEFHQKSQVYSETNKAANREMEKVFVSSQEIFHSEANKNYWKSIAELIPKEVPAIEKRQGKKDQEKKPSVIVIQGPKPGRPTDLARMRQLLIKLKHDSPLHLKPSQPPLSDAKTDATDASAAQAATTASVSTATPASVSTETVAVA